MCTSLIKGNSVQLIRLSLCVCCVCVCVCARARGFVYVCLNALLKVDNCFSTQIPKTKTYPTSQIVSLYLNIHYIPIYQLYLYLYLNYLNYLPRICPRQHYTCIHACVCTRTTRCAVAEKKSIMMFWNTAPSKMMMSKKKYNDVMEYRS